MVVRVRRRGAAQEEDQGHRSEREDHHELEIVDITDDSGLHLYHLVQRRTSTCRPRTPGMQDVAVIEGMIDRCDMTRDRRVIDLLVSDQQIGHDRYANTGPDVTGEV